LVVGCSFQVPGLGLGGGSPDMMPAVSINPPSNNPPSMNPPNNPPLGPTGGPPAGQPDMATAAPDLAPSPAPLPTVDMLPPSFNCDSNGNCQITVQPSQSENIICGDRATCSVDCLVGATCIIDCGKMSRCTCSGDGCSLTGCRATQCQHSVQVCGAQCPDQ
jgi:hypothetical protein